jgi:hypothetical protein
MLLTPAALPRSLHGRAALLNAQSALADVWEERIRSQSEWRSARLRLRAAAGTLGREQIQDRSSAADTPVRAAPATGPTP